MIKEDASVLYQYAKNPADGATEDEACRRQRTEPEGIF